MPVTNQTPIEELAEARRIAEYVLASAKDSADALRAHHARAVLADAFPGQSLAIFARYPDESEARLIQLLSESTVIDLQGDDAYLTREQHQAIELANIAIWDIGDDDELLKHLEASDEEHDDWYEFQLTLHPDIAVEAAAAAVPESL